MKRIQQKLMVTEDQANHIMQLIKSIREKREDYTKCIREDLRYFSSYKDLSDAEIILLSLCNQLHEENWNIINIIQFNKEIENENN